MLSLSDYLCIYSLRYVRECFEGVPCISAGLFGWAMCMTFLTAASSIRIHMRCPWVFGRGGFALYFTLRDGKAIWKTSTVWFAIHTRPHARFLHSELWLTALLIVPDLNKAPRVSELRAGKSCFHLLTSLWGELGEGLRGLLALLCNFSAFCRVGWIQTDARRWIPAREAAVGGWQPGIPSLVSPVWAVCDACMAHSEPANAF